VKQFFYAIILFCVFTTQLSAAGKPAHISRDTSLYAKPFKDSQILASLPINTNLSIIKRKGGWYQVSTADNTGWVRLVAVRLGQVRSADGDSSTGDALELLSGLATGREKSSEVTTASAVKGLGEEELRNATPDTDALDELDEFAADEQAGQEAAEQAGLKPVDIALPEAKKKDKATPPASPNTDTDNGEDE